MRIGDVIVSLSFFERFHTPVVLSRHSLAIEAGELQERDEGVLPSAYLNEYLHIITEYNHIDYRCEHDIFSVSSSCVTNFKPRFAFQK